MEVSKSPWYHLQFHQEANSPYLYKFAQDQWFWFESKVLLPVLDLEIGKQIDTININKSNYTCDEENSKHFMDCMENYYSHKLGCKLPWALNSNIRNDSMNLCKGKEKFKEYKNLAMNILKSEQRKELISEGCFMPNCLQRSWEVKKDNYKKIIKNGISVTGFKYEIFQPAKVLVRKEVKLYTLINFFAEVGGYLGLLLGESLFSYLISASNWFTILRRKFKEHCRKADETPETSSI